MCGHSFAQNRHLTQLKDLFEEQNLTKQIFAHIWEVKPVANTFFVVTKNISAGNLTNCSTSVHKVKNILLSKRIPEYWKAFIWNCISLALTHKIVEIRTYLKTKKLSVSYFSLCWKDLIRRLFYLVFGFSRKYLSNAMPIFDKPTAFHDFLPYLTMP